jgi:hypothetical protein
LDTTHLDLEFEIVELEPRQATSPDAQCVTVCGSGGSGGVGSGATNVNVLVGTGSGGSGT